MTRSARRDRGRHHEQPAVVRADRAARRRAQRGEGPGAGCGDQLRLPDCRTARSRSTSRRPRCPSTGRASTSPSRIAALAAAGHGQPESIDRVVHLGELGLDGRLRPIDGILPAVLAAPRAGFDTVMVPTGNADEAGLVPGIRVIPVASLRDAAIWHGAELEPEPVDAITRAPGRMPIRRARRRAARPRRRHRQRGCRRGDDRRGGRRPPRLPARPARRGQDHARGAPARAAAGARRRSDALEVSSVRSLSGLPVGAALATRPPFEAPHHTASAAALVGGGSGHHPSGCCGAGGARRAVPRRGARVPAVRARCAAAAARVGRDHDPPGQRGRARIPGGSSS